MSDLRLSLPAFLPAGSWVISKKDVPLWMVLKEIEREETTNP